MTNRDRLVVLIVAALALCAGGFFLLVKPQREEASNLAAQVEQERTRLQTAQAAAATAEQARKRYTTDYATVAKLGKAVPADADVASLVYQLEATADRFKVDFRGVTSSGAAAATAPAAAAPATPPATDQKDPTAPPAKDPTAPAAPATQAAAATAPAGTPVGTAGLPTMPFTFKFIGSYDRMRKFLGALDDLTVVRKKGLVIRGRLLTIDGVALKEPPQPRTFPDVVAEVKATAYLVPATEGLTAGATPQAPAGAAPAATGSTTPAPPTAAVTGGLR